MAIHRMIFLKAGIPAGGPGMRLSEETPFAPISMVEIKMSWETGS